MALNDNESANFEQIHNAEHSEVTNASRSHEEEKSTTAHHVPRHNSTISNITNLLRTDFSPKTYTLEDRCTTGFMLFFFSYAITTIISFSLTLVFDGSRKDIGNLVYYIGLIIYQIAVVFVSCWSYKNLSTLPTADRKPTWYELVFYLKFFLCSIFNLITGILMAIECESEDFDDTHIPKQVWILMTITYFINIISIPLPGIVLFNYLHTKKSLVGPVTPSNTVSKKSLGFSSKSPLLHRNSNVLLKGSVDQSQDMQSTEANSSAQLDVRKNVFNDKLMLSGISFAYLIHLAAYILIPALNQDDFNSLLNNIYNRNDELNVDNNDIFYSSTIHPDHDHYNIFYVFNNVILRSFKGMSLNGLCFAFFAAIVASDQERYVTNDMSDCAIVVLLMKNNGCLIICVLLFSILSMSDMLLSFIDERKNFISDADVIDVITTTVNIFMICINIIAIMIVVCYIDLFRGALRKYTEHNERFRGSKTVDNRTYTFKAIVLFLLFIVQLMSLLDQENEWLWWRMLTIFSFCVLQFITLVQLRRIQSNDEYIRWSKKHNRKCCLRWLYFRFLILVNTADLLFVYLYPQRYYDPQHLEERNITRVSYAMSFASGAMFIISLSQLIISYAEFDYKSESQRNTFENQRHTFETQLSKSLSVDQNNMLNGKMKSDNV